ncbi:hypothetical protein BGW36DRAFT_388649 [Talaromyces proteolyticus]|uniref:Uncharacterized protein n=1 Tax=Talaromyces proteolyticus TaxID=1131652 RepID=A0AAD4PSL8_9EURO|nr:uncharacterized protein BGW36DRAFT_388649 [Talaromyces proteolyticus]KAH8691611.1 hypothetical protein BGW36DRAFT_388649 [Talaromyces proteolyticus]
MANTSLRLSLEDDDPTSSQQKIFDILNEVLQPDSITSLEDAAKRLDNLHPDRRPTESEQEDPSNFIYVFFQPFHTVAKQIPNTHPSQDKLAALVNTIQNLPSRPIHVNGWGDFELWSSLPLFGETFSDAYDSDRSKSFDPEVKTQRNLNFQSYGARLMGNGTIPNDRYCIWALADALEGRYDNGKGRNRQILTSPAADPEVDSRIAVATEWILHAGHVFYRSGPTVGGDYHGPLVKGPGKVAFSSQRWQLWKDRLVEFANCDELNADTRKKAQVAALKMEEIEKASCEQA